MTPEAFREATDVSRETLARLETYTDLLIRWTKAVNLVSRNSLHDLWRRHMFDSAQLLPLLPDLSEERRRVIVDLGSGAGFPGMVLSILGAGDVHLVDSDQRKARFLREVAREVGSDAHIHGVRVDQLPRFRVDVVTARAFAPLEKLLDEAAVFLDPTQASNGHGPARGVILKGRKVEEELTAAHKAWNINVEKVPSRSDPSGTILLIGVHGRETTIS
jgi:16S rRNA (guanine527-N7)-methyltransferase